MTRTTDIEAMLTLTVEKCTDPAELVELGALLMETQRRIAQRVEALHPQRAER